MTDQEGIIIEDNSIGTGLDAFRASFRSICEDANVRPTRDVLEQLGYLSLRNLGLALLSAVKILSAANLLSTAIETTFKSDILRLETSLKSDYYPLKTIIPLLETAFDDKSNDHDIWRQVRTAVVNESRRSYEIGSYTKYASNVNGRQYLLQELPNIEQTYDRETWTRITRDLFHYLDHPRFDVRAVFLTFLNDHKKYLPTYCAKWAFPVCAVFRQLAIEMRLAIDLLKFGNWDDGILNDALESLRYTIFDFLGPILMVLQHYCNANKDEIYGRGVKIKIGAIDFLETFADVGNYCIKCLVNAELAFMSLMLHLTIGQAEQNGKGFSQTTSLANLLTLRSYKDFPAGDIGAHGLGRAASAEYVVGVSNVRYVGSCEHDKAEDRVVEEAEGRTKSWKKYKY